MYRPWYDDEHVMAEYLESLEGLNELQSARSNAYYRNNERLQDFYILGSWALDSCGNCSRIIDPAPRDIIPNCPKVLTHDAMFKLMKEASGQPDDKCSITTTFEWSVPRPHLICPECGSGWNIDNCWDTKVVNHSEVVSLEPFVGKKYKTAQDHFQDQTGKIFRLGEEGLRNDRYIDLTPDPRFPQLAKNEKGWSRDKVKKNYVIQKGDEQSLNIWTYYHKNCDKRRIIRLENEHFEEIFKEAGLDSVRLVIIPNEYHSSYNNPWYLAYHPIFGENSPIKIGWRKSVINIDWKQTGYKIEEPFEKEEVTKGSYFIHAHGQKKAVEYLKIIFTILRGSDQPSQASLGESP